MSKEAEKPSVFKLDCCLTRKGITHTDFGQEVLEKCDELQKLFDEVGATITPVFIPGRTGKTPAYASAGGFAMPESDTGAKPPPDKYEFEVSVRPDRLCDAMMLANRSDLGIKRNCG